MKKFFFAVVGVTIGVTLSIGLAGGALYWWFEVRTPSPPDLSIELDGFPGVRATDSGASNTLVRIVLTNNGDSSLSINDAYLYLTRIDDGARANLRFEVGDMLIYPKEKYVEVVETLPARI